jgi:hypothetical protein
VILAAVAYRWSSDLLPLKSTEINPATKADAAAGNFARGSIYRKIDPAIYQQLHAFVVLQLLSYFYQRTYVPEHYSKLI